MRPRCFDRRLGRCARRRRRCVSSGVVYCAAQRKQCTAQRFDDEFGWYCRTPRSHEALSEDAAGFRVFGRDGVRRTRGDSDDRNAPVEASERLRGIEGVGRILFSGISSAIRGRHPYCTAEQSVWAGTEHWRAVWCGVGVCSTSPCGLADRNMGRWIRRSGLCIHRRRGGSSAANNASTGHYLFKCGASYKRRVGKRYISTGNRSRD